MNRLSIIIIFTILGIFSCQQPRDNYEVEIPSPDGKLVFYFNMHDGEPYYLIYSREEIAVDWSWLGLKSESSLNLQEKMLVKEVSSGTGIGEERLLPGYGKPFNSLTIKLQKQDLPEMGYVIEVRIYNEDVVFWYEFEESMHTTISQMTENTELDLYSNDQNWKLDDTLSIADTLKFPVKFISGIGIYLSFHEINEKGLCDGYLLQRKGNLPEFYIRTRISDYTSFNKGSESKIRTGKKIIQIQRNNE